MTFRSLTIFSLTISSLVLGCAATDPNRATATDSGAATTGGTVEATDTSTGGAASTTTTGGSLTGGMTSAPTMGPGSETTQDPGTSGTSGDSSGQNTGSETGGTSTGMVLETSGTSTGEGSSSSTGAPCIPSPEVCNDLDDDCDDIIDNLDVAKDGICDCLSIALFGPKGNAPASEFELWLEGQGTKVDRIQLDNTPLTQQLLDGYDIIILDQLIRNYTADEAKLMQSWVSNNGGLMSLTGYTGGPADVDRPNSLIGPMGLSYNNSKGIINGPVVNWSPHPVSDGITSVTFLGGFYIDIKDDGLAQNTVVATLAPGPVAVAQTRAAGKLLIWGDEWIEFDSEWKNIPQIKQLWVNILAWLSPAGFCTVPQ